MPLSVSNRMLSPQRNVTPGTVRDRPHDLCLVVHGGQGSENLGARETRSICQLKSCRDAPQSVFSVGETLPSRRRGTGPLRTLTDVTPDLLLVPLLTSEPRPRPRTSSEPLVPYPPPLAHVGTPSATPDPDRPGEIRKVRTPDLWAGPRGGSPVTTTTAAPPHHDRDTPARLGSGFVKVGVRQVLPCSPRRVFVSGAGRGRAGRPCWNGKKGGTGCRGGAPPGPRLPSPTDKGRTFGVCGL